MHRWKVASNLVRDVQDKLVKSGKCYCSPETKADAAHIYGLIIDDISEAVSMDEH